MLLNETTQESFSGRENTMILSSDDLVFKTCLYFILYFIISKSDVLYISCAYNSTLAPVFGKDGDDVCYMSVILSLCFPVCLISHSVGVLLIIPLVPFV